MTNGIIFCHYHTSQDFILWCSISSIKKTFENNRRQILKFVYLDTNMGGRVISNGKY